ncbi:MAG: hypothetical protein AAF585_13075 [Verrucomicrobiota bacterium]
MGSSYWCLPQVAAADPFKEPFANPEDDPDLESIDEPCLSHQLQLCGFEIEQQRKVQIQYEDLIYSKKKSDRFTNPKPGFETSRNQY